MIKPVLIAAALASLVLTDHARAADCPSSDGALVVAALTELFAGARADDAARAKAVLAPGFYAFDAGRRLDADALLAGVGAAHKAGRVMEWTVAEPDVHIECGQAWAAWIDKGSIRDATGTQPVTWLESAALEFQGGRWVIRFFSSMRALSPPP